VAGAPAELSFCLAVRDPAVLRVEGTRRWRETRFVQRPERRRWEPEQAARLLDHRILAAWRIVGDVVGTCGRIEGRDHGLDDVVHMDTAEHLPG